MVQSLRSSGLGCLMPNHIHLVATPESEDGLRRATGEAHRRYTRYIDFQKEWKGHLWQGRFASFPMDEKYLIATARYIELPVRAGIVKNAADYKWSSYRAHIQEKDDVLVKVRPLLEIIPHWRELLSMGISEDDHKTICRHERIGRPLGGESFIDHLEQLTSHLLRKNTRLEKR